MPFRMRVLANGQNYQKSKDRTLAPEHSKRHKESPRRPKKVEFERDRAQEFELKLETPKVGMKTDELMNEGVDEK